MRVADKKHWQHHQFMGGLPKLLWPESSLCWSQQCGVWPPGRCSGTVDDQSGALRDSVLLSLVWRENQM